MTPIRDTLAEPGRIYRKVSYGPLLDLFFLDLRNYRGPNGPNLEAAHTPNARIVGEAQMRWLKQALTQSRATWKVIASDKPLGLVDWNGSGRTFEGISNADDGPPLGRELEIAELLAFMRRSTIRNVVWLTAEVHYTAAHYYNPSNAALQEFDPFWEFVSGPLHAGSFGPSALDRTFGPEVRFQKAPAPDTQNLPPSYGLQFFGLVDIDGPSEVMTVRLTDRNDHELFMQTIEPQGVA
jgi:alkaline phosphatase D